MPFREQLVKAGVRLRPTGYTARLALAAGLLLLAGCTRTYYHDFADRDVYGIFSKRVFDRRWGFPNARSRPTRIADGRPEQSQSGADPPRRARARGCSRSRTAVPFEYHGWKNAGYAPIEYLDWQKNISTESDDEVKPRPRLDHDLAIVNSREYQFNYEDLYLAALNLTLARFQFMIQGFSELGLSTSTEGTTATTSNQLQLTTSDGFNRSS